MTVYVSKTALFCMYVLHLALYLLLYYVLGLNVRIEIVVQFMLFVKRIESLSETLLNMSYNGSCEEDFTILGVKL
jgi:hypothetical protein